jgi:hypothetical protein
MAFQFFVFFFFALPLGFAGRHAAHRPVRARCATTEFRVEVMGLPSRCWRQAAPGAVE